MVKERGRRQSGGTISLSGEGGEMEEEKRLIVVLLCFALISNLPEACSDEVCSQLNPSCEHTVLRMAESATRLTTR